MTGRGICKDSITQRRNRDVLDFTLCNGSNSSSLSPSLFLCSQRNDPEPEQNANKTSSSKSKACKVGVEGS